MIEHVRSLYRGEASRGVRCAALAQAAGITQRRATVVAAQLESVGLVTRRRDRVVPVRDVRDAEELEGLLREYEGRRTSDRERLASMMRYAQTAHCRSRYIQRHFGEESTEDCGPWDNCAAAQRAGPPASSGQSAAKARRERARLERLIASAVGNVPPEAASPRDGASAPASRRADAPPRRVLG